MNAADLAPLRDLPKDSPMLAMQMSDPVTRSILDVLYFLRRATARVKDL